MYTRAFRDLKMSQYTFIKKYASSKFTQTSSITLFLLSIGFFRFQFPHDYVRPYIMTSFPGTKHLELIEQMQ